MSRCSSPPLFDHLHHLNCVLLDPGSRCASPHSIDGVTFCVDTWSTSRISMVQVGQMVLDHYTKPLFWTHQQINCVHLLYQYCIKICCVLCQHIIVLSPFSHFRCRLKHFHSSHGVFSKPCTSWRLQHVHPLCNSSHHLYIICMHFHHYFHQY